VLFDKNCFRIFYLKKICLYFSTGDDQPMEPALCQLYRHTFVPCTGTAIVSPRLSVARLPLRAPYSAKRQLPARSGRADGLSWVPSERRLGRCSGVEWEQSSTAAWPTRSIHDCDTRRPHDYTRPETRKSLLYTPCLEKTRHQTLAHNFPKC